MASPFVPCQCSSLHVDECRWDALVPAIFVFFSPRCGMCGNISPLMKYLQFALASHQHLILNFRQCNQVQNLLINVYFLRWDFHFQEWRSALVTGEYVSLSSLNSMCWYVLECSHPIGLNGQVHTGSLNISSTQGLQAVCVSVIVVCHVHSISHHSCLSYSVVLCLSNAVPL